MAKQIEPVLGMRRRVTTVTVEQVNVDSLTHPVIDPGLQRDLERNYGKGNVWVKEDLYELAWVKIRPPRERGTRIEPDHTGEAGMVLV